MLKTLLLPASGSAKVTGHDGVTEHAVDGLKFAAEGEENASDDKQAGLAGTRLLPLQAALL